MKVYKTKSGAFIDLESITAITAVDNAGTFYIYLKLHKKPMYFGWEDMTIDMEDAITTKQFFQNCQQNLIKAWKGE